MVEKTYFILNQDEERIADAELVAFGKDTMVLQVTSPGGAAELKGRKSLKFSIARAYAEVSAGNVVMIDGDRITLGDIENLSVQKRADFKIQANFVTRIVPILPRFIERIEEDGPKSVKDKSRELDQADEEEFQFPVEQEVMVRDISCGGIGFYSGDECSLNFNYTMEIKITEQPIVVELQIIRSEYEEFTHKYVNGARYLNLRYPEESMIRKTIMRIQVLEHKAMMDRLERIQRVEGETK